MLKKSTPTDVEASDLLHRAGFSLGDFATTNTGGHRVYVVTATVPLGQIRAEGSTKDKAWLAALAKARSMLAVPP